MSDLSVANEQHCVCVESWAWLLAVSGIGSHINLRVGISHNIEQSHENVHSSVNCSLLMCLISVSLVQC